METIIPGITAFFGAVGGMFISHVFARRRDVEGRQFEQRNEIYSRMFNTYSKIVSSIRAGDKAYEPSLEEMMEIKIGIMTWGSKETIREWIAFEERSADKPDPVEALRIGDDLFRVLRRDLGHDDTGLGRGELVSLFLDSAGRKLIQK